MVHAVWRVIQLRCSLLMPLLRCSTISATSQCVHPAYLAHYTMTFTSGHLSLDQGENPRMTEPFKQVSSAGSDESASLTSNSTAVKSIISLPMAVAISP